MMRIILNNTAPIERDAAFTLEISNAYGAVFIEMQGNGGFKTDRYVNYQVALKIADALIRAVRMASEPPEE
jgi:hypothetical protein